jgi:hypothetical protein
MHLSIASDYPCNEETLQLISYEHFCLCINFMVGLNGMKNECCFSEHQLFPRFGACNYEIMSQVMLLETHGFTLTNADSPALVGVTTRS